MSLLPGWRPLLRIAVRDVLRARGRSALVVTLVALPVLAVSAADVVYQTTEVSGVEALDRRLGAADARLSLNEGQADVVQDFDPEGFSASDYRPDQPLASPADLRRALGRDVPLAEVRQGSGRYLTDAGVAEADLHEVDLRDPLAGGLYTLESGRLPRSAGEVVVSPAVVERGPAVGDRLEIEDGPVVTVVGVVESTALREVPFVVAPPDGLGLAAGLLGEGYGVEYLVGGGAVSWTDVRALNAVGAVVVSRAVLSDPPPASALPPGVQQPPDLGPDSATVAVVGLVVVMVLLEVVLLAGPAFAVSARRQARTIALLASAGATPAQARRLVLAGGVVLGTVAALVGVVAGIGLAAALLPLLQGFSTSLFGPFDVAWLHLLGIAGFGLVSALLAAVVPAWVASRQDVVAVLAGRRGDRAPSLRSPVLGAALLGVGVAVVVLGARQGREELFIAFGVLPAVAGMILLVPVVLAGVARAGRGLPLAMRYAVRDAVRHRTRTVPAVAAVAASVTGVVALGIAGASDQAQAEATYQPLLPLGRAAVTASGPDQDWAAYRAAVSQVLPEAAVRGVRGQDTAYDPEAETFQEVRVGVPGSGRLLSVWTGSVLGSVLVDEGAGVLGFLGYPDRVVAAADRTLAAGGVVAFADDPVAADQARLTVSDRSTETGRRVDTSSRTVPALWVAAEGFMVPAAILPPELAEDAGVPVTTTALAVSAPGIDEAQEADVDEAVRAIAPDASFTVERGFTQDEAWVVVLLILGALGATLMLGGTLTATALALADARPDLATLSAVGAAPRTRRAVAASFALVVGTVGATLGTLLGLLPGIAITYPLTGAGWVQEIDPTAPDHFLDIPWALLLGLVVGLPLLTALVVGLTVRSRLPLVARLD